MPTNTTVWSWLLIQEAFGFEGTAGLSQLRKAKKVQTWLSLYA